MKRVFIASVVAVGLAVSACSLTETGLPPGLSEECASQVAWPRDYARGDGDGAIPPPRQSTLLSASDLIVGGTVTTAGETPTVLVGEVFAGNVAVGDSVTFDSPSPYKSYFNVGDSGVWGYSSDCGIWVATTSRDPWSIESAWRTLAAGPPYAEYDHITPDFGPALADADAIVSGDVDVNEDGAVIFSVVDTVRGSTPQQFELYYGGPADLANRWSLTKWAQAEADSRNNGLSSQPSWLLLSLRDGQWYAINPEHPARYPQGEYSGPTNVELAVVGLAES